MDQRYGGLLPRQTLTEYLNSKNVQQNNITCRFQYMSAEMFKELSWLPIVKRLKYNEAVFTYKAMNNLTPQYITDLLKPVAEAHNRTLRSSVNGALAVPRSHSSLFDWSYSYTALKL